MRIIRTFCLIKLSCVLQIKKRKQSFDRDVDGIKYQFPERSCKWCQKYPCMYGMDVFGADFAKYGCIHYIEI